MEKSKIAYCRTVRIRSNTVGPRLRPAGFIGAAMGRVTARGVGCGRALVISQASFRLWARVAPASAVSLDSLRVGDNADQIAPVARFVQCQSFKRTMPAGIQAGGTFEPANLLR
jgi:hypothetical protein